MYSTNNQLYSGMVIIELMISQVLGLILLSILLAMYLVSQHTYSLQKALQDIQHQAKMTIAILKDDIKKAGYIGCRQLTKDFPVLSSLPYSITLQNRLLNQNGYLQVRHMSHPSATLQEAMKDYSMLYLDKEIRFSVGDIGIIADCQQVELFEIQAVRSTKQSQTLITTHPLKTHFKKNAEVGKLEINEYWVEKSNDLNSINTAQYSLYRRDIRHRKAELTTHLKRIKIKYSIYQADKLIDKSAEDIVDWAMVQGVSIDLEFNVFSITKIWHTYISLT